MILEHIAINVPDPISMADWYVAHCHMRIVLKVEKAPHTRFLADQKGRTCIEIYANTSVPFPDYAAQHPAVYHQAFAVEDAEKEKDRLLEAGATFFSDQSFPNGTRLIMLRDPWGVALQLVERSDRWY